MSDQEVGDGYLSRAEDERLYGEEYRDYITAYNGIFDTIVLYLNTLRIRTIYGDKFLNN